MIRTSCANHQDGRQHESKAGSREKGTKELQEKFRYPCPMAKETGCTRMYTVPETATNHANCVYHELGHSSPMAKATRCTKISTTSKDAKTHANSVHRKMRHPCPMAEETGCKSTFSGPGNATKHARYVHKGITFPCPFAESVGCDARDSAIVEMRKFMQMLYTLVSGSRVRLPKSLHAQNFSLSRDSKRARG